MTVYPLGPVVVTDVYGIGGRVERVTGVVVGERRKSVVVDTGASGFGRIVVPLSKIIEEEN